MKVDFGGLQRLGNSSGVAVLQAAVADRNTSEALEVLSSRFFSKGSRDR